MSIVTSWRALVAEVAQKFPEVDTNFLLQREGDIGALARHVSRTHDLTFAEAAEVITFRLPNYVEAERLSA